VAPDDLPGSGGGFLQQLLWQCGLRDLQTKIENGGQAHADCIELLSFFVESVN